MPTRTSYVHPSAIRSGDRQYANPASGSRNQSFRRTRSANTEPSFAQQLYASSIKKQPSPAFSDQPSAVSNADPPLGSRSATPSGQEPDIHLSSSINLDIPAPPPIISSAQHNYPPQLVAYLSNSTIPIDDSDSNEHSPAASPIEQLPLTAPVAPSVALVLTPVSPKPIQSAPLSLSDAALLYNSAITPHNTKPYPHRHRANSHSSQPPLSLNNANLQHRHTMQATSSKSASGHSQHTNLPAISNRTLLRTQSYQPVPTKIAARPVTVPSRSESFHAEAAASSVLPYSSTLSSAQTQIVTPPIVVHERHSAPTVAHTKASSLPPFNPTAQTSYHSPVTQYFVSGSQPAEMLVTAAPGWPQPTTYILPPSSHTSLPHTQPSSHSFVTANSQFVLTTPTRGSIPSASSQPSMSLHKSSSPVQPIQGTAPARATIINHPVSTTRGSVFEQKNLMAGLAAGATAGIAGGLLLNSVLGGDGGGDMSGLVGDMGNLMGGSGDNGSGMLNGIFNGGGVDASSDSGGNVPYFDSFNQGNGDGPVGTSVFDPSNQSNQYTQQQGQQQSGPDFTDIAHQAYTTMHHSQQPQQSFTSVSAGNSGGVGQAYQNTHGQTPSGGHHPQHSIVLSYHPSHNAYNNPLPHGQMLQHNQTQQHGQNPQAGQHTRPLFGQNGKIKPTHVKQFAKGALFAGGILAKLNGVTPSNN